MFFGQPLRMREGEELDTFRLRIENAIAALEEQHDPLEAAAGKIAACAQRTRWAKDKGMKSPE